MVCLGSMFFLCASWDNSGTDNIGCFPSRFGTAHVGHKGALIIFAVFLILVIRGEHSSAIVSSTDSKREWCAHLATMQRRYVSFQSRHSTISQHMAESSSSKNINFGFGMLRGGHDRSDDPEIGMIWDAQSQYPGRCCMQDLGQFSGSLHPYSCLSL